METTEFRIRNLAFNQAVTTYERIYRIIFGRQISLLKSLNSGPPQTNTEMGRFCVKARKKNPEFYAGYLNDQWRGSMLHQQVIVPQEEKDVYGVNRNGREFLKSIIELGLDENKYV